MPYVQIGDVQALAPHVPINAQSTPNAGQVAAWIADIETEVDSILAGTGYTTPITGPKSLAILRRFIANAVMAQVMRSRPNPEVDPNLFQQRYDNGMKALVDPANPLSLPDAQHGDLNVKTPGSTLRSNMPDYTDDDTPLDRVTRESVF